MKSARLSLKVMKAYARVFTVGEPVTYRYKGWIEWYSGEKDKAYQSWRVAGEKAKLIPMYYEEGLSSLALASHLPAENPERVVRFERARAAFESGGLDYWVEMVPVRENVHKLVTLND